MNAYTFNHPGGPVAPTTDLLRQMEEVMAQVKPEPIGEWMRSQGSPPETSILVLPERMRSVAGPFPPRYVHFSDHVADSILTRDPFTETLGLGVIA